MLKLLRPFEARRADWSIAVTVFLLSALGMVMIWSASSYTAQRDTGDSLYFVKKQFLGFVAGGCAFAFFCFLDLDRLKKWALPLFGGSQVLLALVFVPGLGVENYGARRWIGLGGVTLQPSEIAKFAFVIFSAAYAADRAGKMEKFSTLLPILGAGGATCLLIIAEPNMSITVCVAAVMMAMLFCSGARIRHLLALTLPLVLLIPLLIWLEPYRMNRLIAFLDPWANPKDEGYQLIQSLYGLGSGGLFGVGLGNSRQKFEFLPFAESDFIFSVIGEELGLFGCLGVLGLFLFLIARGIRTAVNAPDRFRCYLAAGITALVAVQVAVNVAVVTGSIPPTGLPLPFISYGGSSLTVFLGGMGILQNISASAAPLSDRLPALKTPAARGKRRKKSKNK